MVKFKFFGKFVVDIQGEGVADWLANYYGQFPTTESDPADLTLSTVPSPLEPEIQKGDPRTHYGRVDDQFTIKRKRDFAMIDENWSEITVTPETSPWFVTPLVEYPLRRTMAETGFALVHASAAVVSDTTYVFPAWRHTGKTNTMLTLLKDGEGDYLSDDRVFVSANGTVLGFPLPINMYPYNYSALPDLSPHSTSQDVRQRVAETIDSVIDPGRSIVDKGIRYYNEGYVRPELNRLERIERLIPTVSSVRESTIDEVIFLRTTPGRPRPVEIRPFDERDAVADLVATTEGEWNATLREYCAMHDSLVRTGNRLDRFDSFVSRERELLRGIVENRPVSELNVPREEDWKAKRVGERIENAILGE